MRSGEFSRLRQDGTVGYHTFSAVPVLDGDRVIGIEGFLIDITERKHTEDALQKSEEKFARAFQSNPAALVITDLDNGFVTWMSTRHLRRLQVIDVMR